MLLLYECRLRHWYSGFFSETVSVIKMAQKVSHDLYKWYFETWIWLCYWLTEWHIVSFIIISFRIHWAVCLEPQWVLNFVSMLEGVSLLAMEAMWNVVMSGLNLSMLSRSISPISTPWIFPICMLSLNINFWVFVIICQTEGILTKVWQCIMWLQHLERCDGARHFHKIIGFTVVFAIRFACLNFP